MADDDILCWDSCGRPLTLCDDARWRCSAGHEWSNDDVRDHIRTVAEARVKTQRESLGVTGLMGPPVPIQAHGRSSRSRRYGRKIVRARRWYERDP